MCKPLHVIAAVAFSSENNSSYNFMFTQELPVMHIAQASHTSWNRMVIPDLTCRRVKYFVPHQDQKIAKIPTQNFIARYPEDTWR